MVTNRIIRPAVKQRLAAGPFGKMVCMTTRRRRRGTTREEVVNTLLAQELRRHGLSARAERRTREGAPDVRIELRGGGLVLLECKWESSAAQLDEQL